MAKWALYLDESGDSRPHSLPLGDGQTPVFSLAGVALPIDDWRALGRDYLQLKLEFFKEEIDKSSKIAANWEVKGNYLIAPRNRNSERAKVFRYRVIDLVEKYKGTVFGVNFLKSVKDPMSSNSMYTKALQIIAERYNSFLHETESTGITILDSRMAHLKKGSGVDYTVANSYLTYVFGNQQGRQLKNIVEAPLFADSKLTPALQIADIFAAIVYGCCHQDKLSGYTGADFLYNDYSHLKPVWPALRPLVYESARIMAGNRLFGIRNIDHRDGPISAQTLEKLHNRYRT